ncbi:MAG: hypothetical protein HY275_18795 [Gemmatimonadetes bacterium]|nr:hypothetical protein [Gemmatimonadota bacterium]
MPRPFRVMALSLALGAPLVAARPAAAQEMTLEVAIAPVGQQRTAGPMVVQKGVLDDPDLRERLKNAFPARLHFKAELWGIRRWFNDLEGTVEWDLIVRYDPLEKVYGVVRATPERVSVLGRFDRFADAQATVEQGFRVPLVPKKQDRYYYIVKLEVETLSVSDLNEVESWLKGDFDPALRGDKNAGTALGRGLKSLMLRLLGGDRKLVETRSVTFSPQ